MGASNRYEQQPLVLQILGASVGVAMGVVFVVVGSSMGGSGAPPLFGLPFVLAGLASAASAIHAMIKAIRARSEVSGPTPGGPLGDGSNFDLADLTFAEGRRLAPPPPPPPPPALTATQPPPGWYLDPDGTQRQRWWDGRTWTEHRH